MDFERDIFISYAHIDNISLKEGEHGWVANFHRALEVRVAQLMGERPQIWRDQKLQGNDFFGDEIVEQFPKTAVLLSILSPRYIKSEWCTKELKTFIENAENGLGSRIGNKSRVFKLIKTSVPYKEHPPEIADILGYEFFIVDAHTGRIRELSQKAGEELEQIYWAKLNDIAHDICDLLGKIKQTGQTAVHRGNTQLKVYLAETSFDLNRQRDVIKREMTENGFEILPDCRMPFVESEYKKSAADFLDQCQLSIHLVGENYGPVPEGSQKSIVKLQNELAVKKSKTGKLQRLIWLMPKIGAEIEDERQKQFVHMVRTDVETQYGADMFETSIEDFKYAVQDKLKSLQHISTAEKAVKESPLQSANTVYLAESNYGLKKQRESIKRRLIERGFRVLPDQPLPLVYPELTATMDSLLEQCDISIHLLGEDYGVVPDGTEKSVICLQCEQAAEKSRKGELKKIVWVSPTINETDERQQSFIGCVTTEIGTNSHPGMYLLQTPLEDMESTVFERLKAIEEEKIKKSEAEKASTSTGDEPEARPRQIYLICDRDDLDHTTQLEDYLFNSGCDVVLPVFEGDEASLMRDHRESLKSCDAALIYYGSGNELWMRSITRDLTKIAGYGRTRPLQAKAVFLAPPSTRAKERYRSHGVMVINGMEGFSPDLMKPFMEKLATSETS